jgi:hypothetical protein
LMLRNPFKEPATKLKAGNLSVLPPIFHEERLYGR